MNFGSGGAFYNPSAAIPMSSPTAIAPDPMSAAMYSARNCAPEPAPVDWLNSTSNFFAGWGDMLSFGATGRIRQWIGVDDVVDRSSGAYRGGEIVGTVHDLAMAAGSAKQIVRGAKGIGQWGKRSYNLWKRGYKISPWRWEAHHLLPREFKDFFKAAELNIDDYTVQLRRWKHVLRGDGIHAGPKGESWNGMWRAFIMEYKRASPEEIIRHLEQMRKMFGI